MLRIILEEYRVRTVPYSVQDPPIAEKRIRILFLGYDTAPAQLKRKSDPNLIRNEKKIFTYFNEKNIYIIVTQQSINKKFLIYSRIFLNRNISSVNRRRLNLLIL